MADTGHLLTRGAEGLDRRAFTIDEVERMIAAGVLDADERFELIEGEFVPMSPQAMPHMLMKARIARWLVLNGPAAIDVGQDVTLLVSPRTMLEPDVLAFAAAPGHRYIQPAMVKLAVEVADTSRVRDLERKAPLYGGAGVPELWVVDLGAALTHVFRAGAWDAPQRVAFDEALAPGFLGGPSLRLADLL